MTFKLLLATTSILLLAGCTSFHGLKPIYPEVGHPRSPPQVDSLQPTFRWEPAPGHDVSYDFIIYEGIKVESFWEGTKRSVGKEVYYRQDLQTPQHRIEEPLRADAEYYWSVRTRRGEKVSEWTLYDYTMFLGTAYVSFTNQPFLFTTPPNEL